MKSKVLSVLLVALTTASSSALLAMDVYYVNGKSGSWGDGVNYYGGVAPGADDMFWYNTKRFSPAGDRPVTLSLDGRTHYLHRFYMDMDGGVASPADPSPLTLLGPGTLNIQAESGLYHQIAYGREVTFDHMNLVITNHLEATTKGGGLMPSGKITVKGGSVEAVDNGAYITVGDTGALRLEDGAAVRARAVNISGNATVSLEDSVLEFSEYGNVADVTTPNLHIGANSSFSSLSEYVRYWTKGIIPSETNSHVIVNYAGYSAVQPPLAANEHLALRGTLAVTNSAQQITDTSAQTIFTNSVAIYGRGRLMACTLRFASDLVSDVDLSRVDVGDCIGSHIYANFATVNFHNTQIGLFNDNMGATTPGWLARNIYLGFYGRTVFDFSNLNDPSARVTRTDAKGAIRMKDRSELVLCGGGIYNSAFDELPRRFEAYEIGAGMEVKQRNSDYSVSSALRVRDFKMAANSSYTTGQHNQEIEAIGEVSIDPSAEIVHTAYNASNDSCWPAFRSLESEPPTQNLALSSMPEGYSLRWVGGSAFYANDVDITASFSQSYGYWLDGGPDCNFSTSGNWGRNTLYKTGTVNMTLSGKRHTVVTNDVDDVAVKSLVFDALQDGYASSAPFIVRGNPIAVTCADIPESVDWRNKPSPYPAVFSASSFPQTMEARIDSIQQVICVAAASSGERRGILYFKGGIHAPGARFVPMGTIVLGGDVAIRDFNPADAIGVGTNTRQSSPYGKRLWTEVMLKPGCAVAVSEQTSVNSADVMLSIMTNASMTVNGPWIWNGTDTEHVIRGALVLNGTLGGDAVQGFFGKGVLKVKTTDAAGGGRLRIGEGLTLVPTSEQWGSMPLEITDTATVSNELACWTYSADSLAVLRPGHTLTFAGDGDTVLAAPVSGHDVVLRKEGSGALIMATESDGLSNSMVEITDGVFGSTSAQSFGALRMSKGTKLLVDFTSGASGAIAVSGDVSLDGVEIRSSGGDFDGWKDVLRVSPGSDISGSPVAGGRLRIKYERLTDGSTVLKAKLKKGLSVFVK